MDLIIQAWEGLLFLIASSTLAITGFPSEQLRTNALCWAVPYSACVATFLAQGLPEPTGLGVFALAMGLYGLTTAGMNRIERWLRLPKRERLRRHRKSEKEVPVRRDRRGPAAAPRRPSRNKETERSQHASSAAITKKP